MARRRVTLESRLPEIAASLRPRVGRAVKESAQLIAGDARARVELGPPPVHIKDNIEVSRQAAAAYNVLVTAEDEKGRPYGRWHEFGTATTAPAPYLIPALEANANAAEDLVTAALRTL